jgi:uncharacterized GH25 family protein
MGHRLACAAAAVGVSILVVGSLAGEARAHDMWMSWRRGALSIAYGHPGREEAYELDRVVGHGAWNAQGEKASAKLLRKARDSRLVPSEDAAAAWARYDNGIWTGTGDGWQRGLPDASQEEAVESVAHYRKSAVAVLDDWRAGSAEAPPDGAFLLPLENPRVLDAGEKLRVRVMRNGEPVQGAPVDGRGWDRRDKAVQKTNEEGVASVRVPRRGPCMLRASIERPAKREEVDVRRHSATLTFVAEG